MNVEALFGGTNKYIKTIAMDLVVVLVSVVYVFYQMITFELTGLNPWVLLAQAVVGIICGVTIKQSLGENGFSRGYNSETWCKEEDKYNEACDIALPYVDKVDNFYQYEEIDKRKNYRRQHLQEVRLKYSTYFDEDGNYIGSQEDTSVFDFHKKSKLDRKQRKILRKCVKVKIYPLNLFGQYTISTESDTKREITDKDKRAQNVAQNTFFASLIAIIGVYIVPQLNGWNWASFIASTLQVALWIMFGFVQLYTNYNFIVQDKVALLRRKKETIQRFIKGAEKGLYDKSPYDDEEPKKEVAEISLQAVSEALK